ncbi:unnamed protein product [Absidia cylindrospora]
MAPSKRVYLGDVNLLALAPGFPFVPWQNSVDFFRNEALPGCNSISGVSGGVTSHSAQGMPASLLIRTSTTSTLSVTHLPSVNLRPARLATVATTVKPWPVQTKPVLRCVTLGAVQSAPVVPVSSGISCAVQTESVSFGSSPSVPAAVSTSSSSSLPSVRESVVASAPAALPEPERRDAVSPPPPSVPDLDVATLPVVSSPGNSSASDVADASVRTAEAAISAGHVSGMATIGGIVASRPRPLATGRGIVCLRRQGHTSTTRLSNWFLASRRFGGARLQRFKHDGTAVMRADWMNSAEAVDEDDDMGSPCSESNDSLVPGGVMLAGVKRFCSWSQCRISGANSTPVGLCAALQTALVKCRGIIMRRRFVTIKVVKRQRVWSSRSRLDAARMVPVVDPLVADDEASVAVGVSLAPPPSLVPVCPPTTALVAAAPAVAHPVVEKAIDSTLYAVTATSAPASQDVGLPVPPVASASATSKLYAVTASAVSAALEAVPASTPAVPVTPAEPAVVAAADASASESKLYAVTASIEPVADSERASDAGVSVPVSTSDLVSELDQVAAEPAASPPRPVCASPTSVTVSKPDHVDDAVSAPVAVSGCVSTSATVSKPDHVAALPVPTARPVHVVAPVMASKPDRPIAVPVSAARRRRVVVPRPPITQPLFVAPGGGVSDDTRSSTSVSVRPEGENPFLEPPRVRPPSQLSDDPFASPPRPDGSSARAFVLCKPAGNITDIRKALDAMGADGDDDCAFSRSRRSAIRAPSPSEDKKVSPLFDATSPRFAPRALCFDDVDDEPSFSDDALENPFLASSRLVPRRSLFDELDGPSSSRSASSLADDADACPLAPGMVDAEDDTTAAIVTREIRMPRRLRPKK